MDRNLSVNRYFVDRAAEHRPLHRFAGSTAADWRTWRDALRPELMASMGAEPAAVPLSAEILVEWHEDGLVKQKVIFDVERGLSATAYVFRPADARGGCRPW
jgi:hypothetical protein